MSVFPLDSIKVYAESIGISSLKEDICLVLAQEVEFRIRELIQDASKFMIHARRTKLSVEDINYSLKMRRSEPLYGYDPSETLNFRLVPNANIYFCPDPDIDLEAFLAAPLPKAPLKTHFTAHWLAIEGVQPEIPENPVAPEKTALSIPDTKDVGDKAVLVSAKKDITLIQEDAEVTPCVKHVLSKEMQLFYDTVINCINSSKEEERNCALESLRCDAGLQQILPYFVQYATENIARNLKSVTVLMSMIEMFLALASNNHLFLEPYLHQAMPMLLTCITAKTIGGTPAVAAGSSNSPNQPPASAVTHWAVREAAARATVHVCNKYSRAYQTLLQRITKTLLRVVEDASRPVASHYGAFFCLAELGFDAVESIIMPVLPSYVSSLNYAGRFSAEIADGQRSDIEVLYQLLIKIAQKYAASVAAMPIASDVQKENVAIIDKTFGDDLLLMDVQME